MTWHDHELWTVKILGLTNSTLTLLTRSLKLETKSFRVFSILWKRWRSVKLYTFKLLLLQTLVLLYFCYCNFFNDTNVVLLPIIAKIAKLLHPIRLWSQTRPLYHAMLLEIRPLKFDGLGIKTIVPLIHYF